MIHNPDIPLRPIVNSIGSPCYALAGFIHEHRHLCDQDSLHVALVFLGDIFRQNGYTNRQSQRALNPPLRVAQPNEKPDSVTFLLYVKSIFNPISRVLSQHNIKSVGPFQENIWFLSVSQG
ncbi:hypothetical protein B7P43_G14745 [Cryptotermes secundus]|uniref:Uncharacterized protein n=1 Tax=Cryptotermes secundus TaxID=105785 RepID=A0A2J7PTW7_9NEOP|nr:hypothetical protein B7P43_G14745 [Cryptotermes secundus]